MKEKGFCKCEGKITVNTEVGEWGRWDVCTKCGKEIEDSFKYHNELNEDELR